MEEPPPVTVRDPGGSGRPSDVLGDDGPGWRPSRRQLALTALLVATIGAGAGGRVLLERRADQAADRRLGAVVQVERALRFGGETITYTAQDTGTVERRVGVRNTGPRAITVLAATFGSMTLPAPVRLAPDAEAPLRLVQTFDCATRPALLPSEREVQLRVRTEQGSRDVSLTLAPDQVWDEGQARRACNYLELSEAGSVLVTAVRLDGAAVRLDLQVANTGREPLRLLELRGGAGLALDLRSEQGRPVRLPLALLPAAARPVRLTAFLRVTDCAVTRVPGSSTSLTYRLADAAQPTGAGASVIGLPDPTPVADLLERTC